MFRNDNLTPSTRLSMALLIVGPNFSTVISVDENSISKKTTITEGNSIRQESFMMTADTHVSSKSTCTLLEGLDNDVELDQETLLSIETLLAVDMMLRGMPPLVSPTLERRSPEKEKKKVNSPHPDDDYIQRFSARTANLDLTGYLSSDSSEYLSDNDADCEREFTEDSERSYDSLEEEKPRFKTQNQSLQSSYIMSNDFFKGQLEKRRASTISVSPQTSHRDLESDDESEETFIRALGRMYDSQVEAGFKTQNPKLMKSYEKISGFFSSGFRQPALAMQQSEEAEKEVSATSSLRSPQG